MKVRLADGSFVEVGNDALYNDDDTPFTTTTPGVPANGPIFTAADVERIRSEEKDKLYPQIEGLKSTIADLNNKVGTLTQAEEQRLADAQAEKARLEEEARRAEEQGLDARDLIERRSTEWQEQLSSLNQTWEQKLAEAEEKRQASEALLERERQFNDLKDYTQTAVAARQGEIAPQLLPFITGNSQEEIDASIARAVTATEAIAADLQQAMPNGVPPVVEQPIVTLPGTRPTGGPGNTDPAAQFQQLTAEQINNMPMDQYAALRGRLGIGGQSRSQGMFG